jgi:hypothetical protein
MHDMPDTDDADAAAERFWPEEFKWVIKDDLKKAYKVGLEKEKPFAAIYQRYYADRFDSYEAFADRLAEGATIGAENGADGVLEEIHGSIRRNALLPEILLYAVYFPPQPFDEKLKTSLHREVFEEFRANLIYRHIYEDHYETRLPFDEFIDHIARQVVVGAMNGADKALGDIYRAFLFASPLPAFSPKAPQGSLNPAVLCQGNQVEETRVKGIKMS